MVIFAKLFYVTSGLNQLINWFNPEQVEKSLPYSWLWREKSGGFGLSPPYFSQSIIFLAIIKPADSAFWVSGGMGQETLRVAFDVFNKHIYYYLTIYWRNTFQITQTVQQKVRFSR